MYTLCGVFFNNNNNNNNNNNIYSDLNFGSKASFASYHVIFLLCLPLLAIWTSPKAKLSTVDCLEPDRLEFHSGI